MERSVDMIISLYGLPEEECPQGIRICRVLACDRDRVLEFVRKNFSPMWVSEADAALSRIPADGFAAVENGEVTGFVCWDTAARSFFGPIGVREDARGKHIGRALTLAALRAMREAGYGYAVMDWVEEHNIPFYEKLGAKVIPGSDPFRNVYTRLLSPEQAQDGV